MTNVTFSAARISQMHDVLAGFVSRGDVPGLVALVSQGDTLHVEAIGTLALNSRAPVQRDTIFRIASMTKPVTAAAVMLLVDAGKLRLDDPVDHFLPELANRKVLKTLNAPLDHTVPASRPITVRDLLTFTWGFGLVFAPPDSTPILKAAHDLQIGMGPPRPAQMPAPDEWIRRLGTLPLMYQPGEKWLYNTGSDVLSVLVARASGKSFDFFLHERIFEPLGMNDTAFYVPSSKLNRFPTAYWNNFRTGALEVYDPPSGQWSRPPAFSAGSAGLVSTVDDYLAFSRLLLNKGSLGKHHVLSRSSVEAMTRDQLTPDQKSSGLVPGYFDNHGWGFGMTVTTRTTSASDPAGLYGWDGGLGTSWHADPANNFTGILLTQRAWTSPTPPKVCVGFWSSAFQVLHG